MCSHLGVSVEKLLGVPPNWMLSMKWHKVCDFGIKKWSNPCDSLLMNTSLFWCKWGVNHTFFRSISNSTGYCTMQAYCSLVLILSICYPLSHVLWLLGGSISGMLNALAPMPVISSISHQQSIRSGGEAEQWINGSSPDLPVSSWAMILSDPKWIIYEYYAGYPALWNIRTNPKAFLTGIFKWAWNA